MASKSLPYTTTVTITAGQTVFIDNMPVTTPVTTLSYFSYKKVCIKYKQATQYR